MFLGKETKFTLTHVNKRVKPVVKNCTQEEKIIKLNLISAETAPLIISVISVFFKESLTGL